MTPDGTMTGLLLRIWTGSYLATHPWSLRGGGAIELMEIAE